MSKINKQPKTLKQFKHKHHDVVIAYLNGATIETYTGPTFGWLEIENIIESQDIPCFPSSIQYRIKDVTEQ